MPSLHQGPGSLDYLPYALGSFHRPVPLMDAGRLLLLLVIHPDRISIRQCYKVTVPPVSSATYLLYRAAIAGRVYRILKMEFREHTL
jgi:hypothetical protein